MFLQILMGLICLALVAAEAFAGVPARMDSFFSKVSKSTGMPIEEVREYGLESIRETGNFTKDMIERIRNGEEVDLSPARVSELVELIQNSPSFRIRTGLEAVRLSRIDGDAGRIFEQMARSSPERDFRAAYTHAETAEAQLDAAKTTLRALREKLARGEGAVETQKRIDELEGEEIPELETGNIAAHNNLFYAVTNFLTYKRVGFTLGVRDGHSLIILDLTKAPSQLINAIDLETAHLFTENAVMPRPAVAIDITKLDENHSSYDADRSMVFLGVDFLQRAIK